MRATWGVMSARRPIMRPESWSTTLKVRSSRSWPVPVSSDSTVLEQRRHHQLVAVVEEQIEDAPSQLSMAGLGGQDVLDVTPGSSQRMDVHGGAH